MSRGLTPGETALAREVFADAVDLRRVRLYRRGFGGFAVTIGSRIFLPPDLAHADFSVAGLGAKALLVHELVHVWQFQTRPLRTLCSWAETVASGGYGPGLPGYRYPLPVADFGRLNLERQASVVEHAFLLSRGGRSGSAPHPVWLSHLREVCPFPLGPSPLGADQA